MPQDSGNVDGLIFDPKVVTVDKNCRNCQTSQVDKRTYAEPGFRKLYR